jgi:hypothetical protein
MPENINFNSYADFKRHLSTIASYDEILLEEDKLQELSISKYSIFCEEVAYGRTLVEAFKVIEE